MLTISNLIVKDEKESSEEVKKQRKLLVHSNKLVLVVVEHSLKWKSIQLFNEFTFLKTNFKFK